MKKTFVPLYVYVLMICMAFANVAGAQPVASVTISETSGSNPSCSGALVTFTAVATNGGSIPSYAWYLDGTRILGASASTYSTSSLAAGSSSIYCVMTSNLAGVLNNPAVSDTIYMRVYEPLTASLSGTTSICPGDSAILSLHLTGTAPFSGTLSDSSRFHSSSDTILVTVYPDSTLTYHIAYVSDSSGCTAASLTGSATITVKSRPTAILSGDTTVCAGSPATVTVTPIGTGPFHGTLTNGVTFSGSGSTIHVNVSPSADSTYYITSLSDANCTAIPQGLMDSAIITVIPRPVAMISDSDTICNGSNATLTLNLSNGAPWQVVYTNGIRPDTVTVDSSPYIISVSPTATTSYHITSVTGVSCASHAADISGIGMVVVNPNPVAVINPLPSDSECLTNNSFAFKGNSSTISSGSIVAWKWTFNGQVPDTASGPTPTVQFLDTGWNDYATLEVISNKGCYDYTFITFSVKPSPSPSFQISDSAICVGNSVQAIAVSGSGYSYTWMWGDGVDTSCTCNELSYPYLTSGDKRLKISVTNTYGCTDTSSKVIHVHALPLAAFTIADTAQCFAGNDFVFTDHSTMPAIPAYGDTLFTRIWDFGDQGAGSDSISPIHSYISNTRNTYTVTETVTSSFGCADSVQKHVTIFQTPDITIANSSGMDSICVGTGYTLTAQTDALSPLYLWSVSDTTAKDSTSSISRVSFATAGTSSILIYTVMITDTGNNKCANTLTDTITSIPNPTVPVIDSGAIPTACPGSTLHFDVTNVEAGVNYFWYTSPSLPISGQDGPHSNITFTADSAIVYLTATNTPWGCTVSQQITIITDSATPPSVSIVEVPDLIDSTLIALATPDSALTYQWGYDGPGLTPYIISGATTQDLLLDSGQNSANYWVIVTDTQTHCSTKVYFVAPVTTTGIKDINGNEVIVSVYPNPTSDRFNLSINAASAQNWSIEVLGLDGKLIAEKQINSESNVKCIFDASVWPAGNYILKVTSASGDMRTLKLIRE